MTATKIEQALNYYLVGGAVRDQLLARKVIERDYVVVGSTVEQMLALGFEQVGKDFPVFLHPKTKEEFALARTEKKQGVGYTGFVCNASQDITLEEDLLRRDLTVNAMAIDKNGEIFDPYKGQQDLHNKILRHVSPAFAEDPLRVLRVARFACRYHYLGFSVATETIDLMSEIAQSGELNALSAERIWQEIEKSLTEQNPEIFFEILRSCNALKVIWPDLDALWGIPNPAKWHPEICSGIHTMMVLQQAVLLTDKVSVRFAALCHDLGKTLTPQDKWPSHYGHEKSGLPLIKNICQQLKVPKQTTHLALLVCEYHLHCHKAFELKPATIIKLFNALDLWRKPELLDDFLLACEADFKGREGNEQTQYPQANYLKQAARIAAQVSAKQYVEQGLKGLAIKDAIHQERIKVLSDFSSQRTH